MFVARQSSQVSPSGDKAYPKVSSDALPLFPLGQETVFLRRIAYGHRVIPPPTLPIFRCKGVVSLPSRTAAVFFPSHSSVFWGTRSRSARLSSLSSFSRSSFLSLLTAFSPLPPSRQNLRRRSCFILAAIFLRSFFFQSAVPLFFFQIEISAAEAVPSITTLVVAMYEPSLVNTYLRRFSWRRAAYPSFFRKRQ